MKADVRASSDEYDNEKNNAAVQRTTEDYEAPSEAISKWPRS